jgi:hypothetical protein
MGLMKKFLGVQILQTPKGIFLHQTNYCQSILAKYSHCRPNTVPLHEAHRLRKETCTSPANQRLYQALVGKLYYLTKTHTDIGFATSLLSIYMHCFQERHMQAVDGVINYLRLNPSLGVSGNSQPGRDKDLTFNNLT